MRNFLLFLCLSLSLDFAFCQSWEWAKAIHGKNTVQSYSVAADNKGSIYVAGTFKDTAVFGISDSLFTSYKNYNEAFIAKYNENGDFIWARSFGGNRNDVVYAMTCDNNGAIYLACHTRSTSPIQYDGFSYSGTGNSKIFILKIDSTSKLIWSKVVTSGISTGYALSISVNNTGSLAISGYYTNLDFTIDSSTLSHIESDDAFIATFSSLTGQLKWVKSANGFGIQRATFVTIDDNGNVYTNGIHNKVIRFTPNDTLWGPSSFAYRSFLSKHDSSGNLVWLKAYYGPNGVLMDGIALGKNADIYLSGYHASGSNVLNDSTFTTGSFFVQKVSPQGNSYWTRNFSAGPLGRIDGMATDSLDNVYLAGFTGGTATFDTFVVKGLYRSYRNFIAKLGPNGETFIAAGGGNHISDEGLNYLAVSNDGSAYIVGFFGLNVDDTSFYDSSSLISEGNYDAHLAKFETSSICGVQAEFKISSKNTCPNNEVTFTNITPLATDYTWKVNDSLISEAKDTSFLFTQAGNYVVKLISSTTQCSDSVSHVIVVNPNYHVTHQYGICKGDSVLIAGEYHSTSGTYYDSLKNTFDCDSVLKYELTVNPDYYDEIKQSICEGDSFYVFGTYLKVTGTYTDSLKTANGCDSISVLGLTVNALPSVNFSGLDSSYCLKDASSTLTGIPPGGIFSGTGISGNVFSPSVAGIGSHTILYSYSDSNACTNKASDETRVNLCTALDKVANDFFQIYPNPGTGVFSFKTSKEEVVLIITDLTGKTVFTTLLSGNDSQNGGTIDLRHLASGHYQVKAISGDNIVILILSIN